MVGVQRVLLMSALSLAFAITMGFSALVKIPLPGTPVPLTLQTFVLLAGAGVLTRWYALQMVLWYLLIGIVGAPFFAGGSGLTHLAGASGGYLIGFFFAAAIVGFSAERKMPAIAKASLYVMAALSVYVAGVVWLKFVTQAGWLNAVAMGVYPFVLIDVVKAITAYFGVERLKNIFGR